MVFGLVPFPRRRDALLLLSGILSLVIGVGMGNLDRLGRNENTKAGWKIRCGGRSGDCDRHSGDQILFFFL